MPQPDSSPTDTADRHVFVYGTLRCGGSNDITRLLPAPRWLGEAEIAGSMYDFGRYPGVVLGGQGRVVGEVYAISAELERLLDEIEEVYPQQSDEYFRREVSITVGGQSVSCLIYAINPRYVEVRNAPLLPGGDWMLRGGEAARR